MTNLITLLDGAIYLLPIITAITFVGVMTYRSLSARFA
jgi:hypothetical protein